VARSRSRGGSSLSAGKKGVKDARFDLIPVDALWSVAKVFGKGAEKYAVRNWERGYDWSKTYGAMQRHLSLFWQGEDRDPETGLPHLAHVAWHALALLTFYLRGTGTDDRPLSYDPDRAGLESMTADVTNPEEITAAKAEVKEPVYPDIAVKTLPSDGYGRPWTGISGGYSG